MPRRAGTVLLSLTLLSGSLLFAPAPVTAHDTNVLCQPGFEAATLDPNCWTKFTPGDAATTQTTTEKAFEGSRSLLVHCTGEGCFGGYTQYTQVPATVDKAVFSAAFSTDSESSPGPRDCGHVTLFSADFQGENEEEATFVLERCGSALTTAWATESNTQDVTAWLQDHLNENLLVYVIGWEATGETGTDYYFDKISLTYPPLVTDHARALNLALNNHLKARGVLSLIEGGRVRCIKNVTVKIQKRIDGVFKTIASDTTDELGIYTKELPDKPGKYRTLAPKFELSETEVCARAVSPVKTHSH